MKSSLVLRCMRRLIVILMVALPLSALADYPDRPIRLIVGYPAGGGVDAMARALASEASRATGWDFVVVNQPGASGSIAAKAVSDAAADGYTIGLAPSTTFTIVHLLSPELPNLIEMQTPLVSTARVPTALIVRADSPFKNLADLLEQARRDPGKVSVGVPGKNNKLTVVVSAVAAQARVDLTTVPFLGDAPGLTALLGGHISSQVLLTGSFKSQLEAGKVRVLAWPEEYRFALAPDAPALRELGFPFAVGSFSLIHGPKNLPEPVIEKLTRALSSASRSPGYLATLSGMGFDNPRAVTGAELRAALQRQLEENRDMINLTARR